MRKTATQVRKGRNFGFFFFFRVKWNLKREEEKKTDRLGEIWKMVVQPR